MAEAARETVETAVEFAHESPLPTQEELYTDVYAEHCHTGTANEWVKPGKNLPRGHLRRIVEEMERDENIFIMGEEVGVWGGTYAVTRGFYDKFAPKRVRDTPISEMAIVGAATGAAMNGLRPIAELMTINFAFVALDAIVNRRAPKYTTCSAGSSPCRW